jgi:serpin B
MFKRSRSNPLVFALVCAQLSLLTTCLAQPEEQSTTVITDSGQPATNQSERGVKPDEFSVADACNAYGFDLFVGLSGQETGSGNLLFSPYSISSAMVLVAEGSRGVTADQLAATFHFGPNVQAAGRAYSDLNARLFAFPNRPTVPPAQPPPASSPAIDSQSSLGQTGSPAQSAGVKMPPEPPVLVLTNGLWIQHGITLNESYLQEVQRHHGASVEDVDFLHQPVQATEIINHWIDERTGGRITHLIDNSMANPATQLVLVNALYFKGRWKKPFLRSQTWPAPFKGTSDPKAMVPMMKTSGPFKLAHRAGYRVIELPYATSTVSMAVFLPDRIDGLTDLVKKLDLKMLESPLLGVTEPTRVELHLPRFSIARKIDLTTILKYQIPSAFSRESADFSGMTGGRDVRLSSVLHQTFLEVNEVGSEAASATSVGIIPRGLEDIDTKFVADHPFLFLIRDNATGAVLFLGTLTTP